MVGHDLCVCLPLRNDLNVSLLLFTNLFIVLTLFRAPVSGGQYFWVSMLAPASVQRPVSYVTGWMTIFGWLFNIVNVTYLVASRIPQLASYSSQSYQPQDWQIVLLMWALILTALAINSRPRKVLAWFVGVILLIHVLAGLVVVIIACTFTNFDRLSAIVEWSDDSTFPTRGLSFLACFGFLNTAFCGGDVCMHVSCRLSLGNLLRTVSNAFVDG